MKNKKLNHPFFKDNNRDLISIKGEGASKFLQNIITQDIFNNSDELKYSALLSPQGKYLFDFFIFKRKESFVIDINKNHSEGILEKINFYKLRLDITVKKISGSVILTMKNLKGFFKDPRHPELHNRGYYFETKIPKCEDFDLDTNKFLRVKYCIPENEKELLFNETYILEAGFERINGLNFNKGCYIGQEVTSRMKHKANLRKGYIKVKIQNNEFIEGKNILSENKIVGKVTSQYKDYAIAYLNFKYSEKPLFAGNSELKFYEDLNGTSNDI